MICKKLTLLTIQCIAVYVTMNRSKYQLIVAISGLIKVVDMMYICDNNSQQHVIYIFTYRSGNLFAVTVQL